MVMMMMMQAQIVAEPWGSRKFWVCILALKKRMVHMVTMFSSVKTKKDTCLNELRLPVIYYCLCKIRLLDLIEP